jgi:hypothetical protein
MSQYYQPSFSNATHSKINTQEEINNIFGEIKDKTPTKLIDDDYNSYAFFIANDKSNLNEDFLQNKYTTQTDQRKLSEAEHVNHLDGVVLKIIETPVKNLRKIYCVLCGGFFCSKFSLTRHKNVCKRKNNTKYTCIECSKTFQYKKNLTNHLKIHISTPLFKFSQIGAGNQNKEKHRYIHCHQCSTIFENKRDLYKHYMLNHQQIGGQQLQPTPWGEELQPPWVIDGVEDQDYKDTYNMHAPLILQNHKISPLTSTYNFPITNNVNLATIMEHIKYIYGQENKTFKINFSFGFILRHIETNRYRYYKPYTNQCALRYPFLISDRNDFKKFEKEVDDLDILNHILLQRENTKYKPILITNVVYYTYSELEHTLGDGLILPNYIKYKKCIVSLHKNAKYLPYDDHLCFFRCLSYHTHPMLYKNDRNNFEKKVYIYFEQYQKYMRNQNEFLPKTFKGVDFGKISLLEICFNVNINIFELYDDNSCSAIYKSLVSFDSTMNLNKYDSHLSYITDISQYCSKFRCSHCTKLFKRKDMCKVHEKSCGKIENFVFVGGFLKSKLSIFEELDTYGIHVSPEDRFFKEFIVFDMEAMMHPNRYEQSSKLIWTFQHIPISSSVCSNHKDFTTPHCIVNEHVESLTKEMMQYISIIANSIREDKINSFRDYFEQLDFLIYEWENTPQNITDKTIEISISQKIMLNQLNNLRERFLRYCSEIPVLGFNSGRYDINLIKGKIIEHLKMHEVKKSSGFVIKRNNCYSCISNGELRFLDVTHFLSPGTSYSKFLKAYDANSSQSKGYFPYEHFRSPEQLNDTQLPPLGPAWWSSVKNKCILGDDKLTIERNYNWLKQVWNKQNMKTFKDFLIWYNNLDVGPFISALSNLTQFYFKWGIDIFKESISIPGIARKMIFQAAQKKKVSFSLIDNHNSDLHFLISRNLVGGPAIIFNRFHKKNETFIRNNKDFPCKSIIGYDANSLYLWAIGQKMPGGGYVRRKFEKNFYPEKSDKYQSMFYWMDWLNTTQNLNISHYQNRGFEHRVGPYLCDGIDSDSDTIYQYNGCYYHAHSCLSKKIKSEIEMKKYINRQKNTNAAMSYIKSQGYRLVVMYECEFNKLRKNNKTLQEFISHRISPFTRKKHRCVTQEEIIKGVLSEDIFGMVEVDISVPNNWDEVCFHPETTLSPRQYFSEMCPLFGTADIGFEHIGEVMQQHIIKNNLSQRPRRLLISAMKAEKILLATPLLIWYIKHGMKITKIHQVIEYNNPSHCFKDFVDDVTKARREGDLDPTKAVLADTMKLLANSAYGSFLMNKARYKDVYYVRGLQEASNVINKPLFERLTEIGPEYYEVESFKNKYILNLPIQLGYYILQLAKLRMLQFYYDFLDKFVPRECFELCEMDTDSSYLALSSEKIEYLIKPEMKTEYEKWLTRSCTNAASINLADKFWFPRICCDKHNRFDQRTPGLFKTEFFGEQMISLCSKTYLATSGEKCKFSSKGLNKHNIKNPLSIFKQVLEQKKSGGGINVGFRLKDNQMFTYSQDKNAFSYFYCKRRVLSDGIQTVPLDVTLKPLTDTDKSIR